MTYLFISTGLLAGLTLLASARTATKAVPALMQRLDLTAQGTVYVFSVREYR